MNPDHLLSLIARGEAEQVEFKRELPSLSKLTRTLSALANTAGGVLILGVTDAGEAVGVANIDQIHAQVEQAAQFWCDPPVPIQTQIVVLQGQEIMVVEVPDSSQKPHAVLEDAYGRGKVYLRQASSTLEASPQMIKLLAKRSAQPPVAPENQLEQALFNYLAEHPRITLPQYCQLVNISKRRAQRTLVKWMRAGHLNCFQHERVPYYALNSPAGND
ncbi:MAG: ATP-binding protein [Synechococcaceae cyanobacterium SM2_3_1]|nr:ATP-binding protein [Synechococcaceae cyanobacterium SM2_3_1]